MLGRTPDSILAIRPLSKGVISDYDYAEQMMRIFIRKVCAYKMIKPRGRRQPAGIGDGGGAALRRGSGYRIWRSQGGSD